MTLEERALALLRANRRTTRGHQYTLPSPTSYPYQWLWDSCFHAIVLARLEPDAAKKELESLVSRQFENGMIPHIIYWEKPPNDKDRSNLDIAWGKNGTS
ncbi:MAG: hypothetical protein Q8P36_01470, partial [bacterium]|nr:hypothetical protein [bacterium]